MSQSTESESRKLLVRLRETLAMEGAGQARLDRITHLIADSMGTEVCSVYLFRDAETLELCATQGLNPEAVHKTRMRIGEGLVDRRDQRHLGVVRRHLPLGLFGASTGAAAALVAAARAPGEVAAVVSRGGRPKRSRKPSRVSTLESTRSAARVPGRRPGSRGREPVAWWSASYRTSAGRRRAMA